LTHNSSPTNPTPEPEPGPPDPENPGVAGEGSVRGLPGWSGWLDGGRRNREFPREERFENLAPRFHGSWLRWLEKLGKGKWRRVFLLDSSIIHPRDSWPLGAWRWWSPGKRTHGTRSSSWFVRCLDPDLGPGANSDGTIVTAWDPSLVGFRVGLEESSFPSRRDLHAVTPRMSNRCYDAQCGSYTAVWLLCHMPRTYPASVRCSERGKDPADLLFWMESTISPPTGYNSRGSVARDADWQADCRPPGVVACARPFPGAGAALTDREGETSVLRALLLLLCRLSEVLCWS
jgi:hypothetical protein